MFQREEQRHWSLKYMEGQMLDLERKSFEPMARALEGGNVQAMQQFASASPWEDQEIIHVHQKEVGKTLGQKDGVIIGDGSDFPKREVPETLTFLTKNELLWSMLEPNDIVSDTGIRQKRH